MRWGGRGGSGTTGQRRSDDRVSGLIRPEAIAEFRDITIAPRLRAEIVDGIRHADEVHELEPAIMRIIGEVDETPHGPTEAADIITVHLHVEDEPVLAALVLKGKAWPKVRGGDLSHQLLRAAQVPTVGLMVLVAVGDVQDEVKGHLAFIANGKDIGWLLLDRGDVARLLVAYKELCPNDGT